MAEPNVDLDDDYQQMQWWLEDVRLSLIEDVEKAVTALKAATDDKGFADALVAVMAAAERACGPWDAALEGMNDWRLQHRRDE